MNRLPMPSPWQGFRLYLAIATGICSVIAIYYLWSDKLFLFADIGTDTLYCFYPLQVGFTRQWHALHSLTWSFDLGLGGYLGTLFDPLWLVSAWFPEDWQAALRLPMFCVRILAAGGFFYAYLARIGLENRLAIIGALGFAFSSYGVINAQWEVVHGTEFVQFAAYLYFFETYVRTRNHWAAVGAGVVVGLGNPFGLYLFALLSLVLMVVRFGIDPSMRVRRALGCYASFAAWCIVGLLLTAPLILPAAYYFLDSPRVSGDQSILHAVLRQAFSLNGRSTISSEVGGFLGKDLFGTGNSYTGWGNYFEGPGFYVGLLPLLCIPQLLGPTATRRERMLCMIALLAILAYLVFPGLRYAVYAFGHTGFRFSTVWISAAILLLGLAGLRRATRSGPWLLGVALGTTAILAIGIGGLWFAPESINATYVAFVAAFAVAYSVLLPGGRWFTFPGSRHLLLAAVAIELLLFSMPAVVLRAAVDADGSSPAGTFEDGTGGALAIVAAQEPDERFYRVEKTYNSVFFDDSLVQDYPGTRSYYFHGQSITRFVDSLAIPRGVAHSNYISAPLNRPALLDLLAVEYLLTRDRQLDGAANMEYVGSADGIHVYRRQTALPFGFFVDDVLDESVANAMRRQQRDAVLRHTAIVEDAIRVGEQLANLDAGAERADTFTAKVDLRKLRDDHFSGTTRSPRAAILMLSMPFDRGWKASIDGVDSAPFRADYGLTALLVPPGEHRVVLSYSPVGRITGWWLAAAAVAFLLLHATRQRMKWKVRA